MAFAKRCHVHTQDLNRRTPGHREAERENLTTAPRASPSLSFLFSEEPQEKLEERKKKFEELKKKFVQTEHEKEERKKKFARTEHEKEERKKKFEELKKKFEELQKNFARTEHEKEELQKNFVETKQDKEERKKKFEELQKNFARTEHEKEELQKNFVETKQDKEERKKKFEELKKKFEELKKNLDKWMTDLEDTQHENEELKKKVGELEKNLDELRNELARRKAQFKSTWKKAPLYPDGGFYVHLFLADWRKEEFKAVNVTLDAATAHPVLLLSEKGRRVTWQERCQDLPSSTQRFNSLPCVLGQLDISSGRWYWEVEVGEARSWDLGICRDNVTRKERVTMSPQNGFWAIRLYDGDYWALTSRVTLLTLQEKPLIVGIFLDYEAGDVSFYNMTDGSHIFTFPQNTFYGILRPLFRLWSSDSGSLTIVQVEEN
ncbi:E3 ubiquitin-protein ligase TRIM38-like isoform X2 [Equus asinus]|uniref:E3 ubiquitin-protein ligase TRIM38-like isoform X2 n=1 Tax=Equus asinus TaxID=9793 RepID=UPI0038F66B0E